MSHFVRARGDNKSVISSTSPFLKVLLSLSSKSSGKKFEISNFVQPKLCLGEKFSVTHSSISSDHDSLLCMRRPFIGIPKENEVSKEYKASYNKKLIIEDFKRYSTRITPKRVFLTFYKDIKTALFPDWYHGKIQLLCIRRNDPIEIFCETAGSPYFLLYPTSSYPSVLSRQILKWISRGSQGKSSKA